MAIDVHLVRKQGTAPPTSVAIDIRSIAANLSFIDRRLKKAGQPELRPFFECDDETWLQPGDVRGAFENARAAITDADFFEDILFEVVVEQLGPAIDVLRALPKGSVMRLEIINPKRRKPAKPKPASTG